MAENYPSLNPDHPAQYRIYAQGDFNPYWLDWLSGEWIIVDSPPAETGATILVGRVVDQAALLGVLNGLYGLGLYLLLVECLAEGRSIAHPD